MFFSLQYRLWVGEGSFAEVKHLEEQIANQKLDLKKMQQENLELQAEIEDLKAGLDAVEERARTELGMTRQGEIYFQIVEPRAELNED
jgi:cell division protein FtsB